MRTKLGSALLALYPEAWRARYGEEARALIEDDPPGAGGLASLLVGAGRAHVRPQACWRATPAASMRLSIGALFACWILVSLAGSLFAKVTEHTDAIEHEHRLLNFGRGAITAGALLGAVAIAVGGLPLLWQALRAAAERRDRRLGLLILSPAIVGALVVGLGAVLVAVAPSRHGGFPTAFVLALLVPASLGVLACALTAALAPKAVMRRAEPSARLLRRAAWSGQALALAILLVAAGLVAYVPALWSADAAGTAASGPLGLSTRATLLLALAGAVFAAGPALLAATRARRAALTR